MNFEPVELAITELDLVAGGAAGAVARASISQRIHQSVDIGNVYAASTSGTVSVTSTASNNTVSLSATESNSGSASATATNSGSVSG
jgi:hypothetical protein